MADGTVKEYRYGPHKTPRKDAPFAPDSLGALIEAYKRSPEWRGLSDKSRVTYNTYIQEFQRNPHAPARGVTRRDIRDMRDAIATTRGNGAGTGFVRSASVLFGWAVEAEWIEFSPVSKIKPLPRGHLPAWSDEHAALALAGLPEPLRRVVVLGLHTGQRRGDLVRLRWADYDGQWIQLIQQKTKAELTIPVNDILRAELAAWEASQTALTILTNDAGAPWNPQRLSEQMGRALARIDGLPGNLNIHGVRKLAATRHANAGSSAHEIASITGHKTLGMVELYTRSADQKKLAEAAMLRLYPVSATITKLRKTPTKTGG